jgi:hypothetical protein
MAVYLENSEEEAMSISFNSKILYQTRAGAQICQFLASRMADAGKTAISAASFSVSAP